MQISQKIKIALSIIAVLMGTALILKQCNKPIPYVPLNIKNETRIKDSFRVVIKIHDSTRLHHLNKWRTIVRDSTPCYTEIRTVIAQCDTVIKYDSIEIVALKGLVNIDSVIIGKLSDKVLSDSLTIKKLNKRLKRQKLITKFAFGLGATIGAAGGYNVKP